MKVLLTGGSSFTGYWFIKELAQAGHEVVATFTQGLEDYTELRGRRVSEIGGHCTPMPNCAFGDDKFLDLVEQASDWDLICHHGAFVRDYKSMDFDVIAAVQSNSNNLKAVLENLSNTGCNKLLLTGSVFEQDEGMGEHPLRAFSPYGLSKGLTAQLFSYWCR